MIFTVSFETDNDKAVLQNMGTGILVIAQDSEEERKTEGFQKVVQAVTEKVAAWWWSPGMRTIRYLKS